MLDTMIKPFVLMAALILWYPGQDVQVATWSAGTPDSDTYESLSFWIKDNQRAYIRYSHGKDAESADLNWLGPDSLLNAHGFRVSSPVPGHASLFIILKGDSLRVFDKQLYDRSFHWENENDSSSTQSCLICATSAKQAIVWLRRYFF
jgi:hypothetical protein